MSTIKLYQLYKHKNSRDCAAMPISIKTLPDNKIFVTLQFFNTVNPNNIFTCGKPSKHTIDVIELVNWIEYTTDELSNL